MDIIRAVTIRQPEVTRLAAGEARVEVKTWRTDYRGDILLVSALTPWIEPAGYAIAVGQLVDCRPMNKADEADAGKKFYANAQAWVFATVRPIRIFPVKIGRNVFEVEIPSFGIQRIAKVALTPAMDWSRKNRVAGRRVTTLADDPIQSETATGTSPPHTPPLDVLIVDSDPLLARGVERCVLSDHRVRSVPSCAQALDALKARPPDVVIFDFQLGSESSAPLVRALASNYPNVRRVLYSSSHRDVWARTIDGALLHGALTKPATRQQLLAAISA
ncbi:MAG: response regulator [Pseudomonadota bacterium]